MTESGRTGHLSCRRSLVGVLAAALLTSTVFGQAFNYELVHAFQRAGGTGLVQGADGSFYGITWEGENGLSTIFRMDSSAVLTTLHSFNGADGAFPAAALIQASDGDLYGTTVEGGSSNLCGSDGYGTVFRVDSSGHFTSLHGFDHVDGWDTASALLEDSDGLLYGLTPAGGAGGCPPRGCGTVFKMDMLGSLSTLHSFVGEHYPVGALIQATDGNLYGATHHGGSDVPCPGPFAGWIEQLATEQITGGCGGGNYCPGEPVTRAQVAAFLLKTEHGQTFTPPACAGIFDDVACPSQFADWIEELSAEGVTGGCHFDPALYRPASAITRGQIAVFLVKAFGLR